jgi:hypothetical protein
MLAEVRSSTTAVVSLLSMNISASQVKKLAFLCMAHAHISTRQQCTLAGTSRLYLARIRCCDTTNDGLVVSNACTVHT